MNTSLKDRFESLVREEEVIHASTLPLDEIPSCLSLFDKWAACFGESSLLPFPSLFSSSFFLFFFYLNQRSFQLHTTFLLQCFSLTSAFSLFSSSLSFLPLFPQLSYPRLVQSTASELSLIVQTN